MGGPKGSAVHQSFEGAKRAAKNPDEKKRKQKTEKSRNRTCPNRAGNGNRAGETGLDPCPAVQRGKGNRKEVQGTQHSLLVTALTQRARLLKGEGEQGAPGWRT